MVAVRKEIGRTPRLTVSYDRRADVLYVALGRPVPDEGEDRPKGLILRYTIDRGFPSGVTVVGYHKNHWSSDILGLSETVAHHLGLNPMGVQRDLEQALKDQ